MGGLYLLEKLRKNCQQKTAQENLGGGLRHPLFSPLLRQENYLAFFKKIEINRNWVTFSF